MTGMSASSLDLKVYFWIDTFDKSHSALEIQSQTMNEIIKALAKANINMPGDIIELKNYKDSPLKTGKNSDKAKQHKEEVVEEEEIEEERQKARDIIYNEERQKIVNPPKRKKEEKTKEEVAQKSLLF